MTLSFSAATQKKIDEILRHYPNKRAPLIPVLVLAQEEFGELRDDVKRLVATTLELNPSEVQEAVTFYSQLKERPVGKIHFQVCKTLSCDLAGGEEILEYLREKLGVEANVVTPDGRFSYEGVECLASCDTAPAMFCRGRYFEKLTRDQIDAIIRTGRLE